MIEANQDAGFRRPRRPIGEVLAAETRRAALDSLNDGLQKAIAQAQEGIKAEQRGKQSQLFAPVDGSVQQLAIHTVGGVVTPAQALLLIVPKDNPLEIEAVLDNKDIGFVNAGQAAQLKIEIFPFTKYGTVPGEVIHVSTDAVTDEKRGAGVSGPGAAVGGQPSGRTETRAPVAGHGGDGGDQDRRAAGD